MEQSEQTKLKVGYGTAREGAPFGVGRDAAAKACAMLGGSPVAVVLVFASVRHDLEEVLRGIASVFPGAPLLGCSTAGEICQESLSQSVVVTALASSYLKVSSGIGRGVSRNWQAALEQAVQAPGIHELFHDVGYWQELTLKGKTAFAILLTPGNTRHATTHSFEILEAIKLKSLGRLPIFGGSTADDWRMEENFVFLGKEALPDSILLAVFETQLQFGIAMDHGFIPTRYQTTVTRSEGHEVLELDGAPAAEVYARIVGSARGALEGKHLTQTTGHTMGVADLMGQYSINVASFFTPRGGVNFTLPVPASSVLTLMKPNNETTFLAGKDALRKALMRGGIADPALSLVAYCALRPRIIGEKSREEVRLMAGMLADSPLVGFGSFGEQGVGDDGTVRHNNSVISVLVLGRELSPNARVALENEKMQQRLQVQAVALSETNRNLLAEISERIRIEGILHKANDELDYRVKDRTADLVAANEQLRHEVDERRGAEVRLQLSNQRFQTLAGATFEGIAVTENCRFLDANAQMSQILGYQQGELIGMDIRATLPEGERTRVVANLVSGVESPYEFELRRKDGALRVVEAHGQSIVQDGRKLRITAIRDITERKSMEKALQQSEELFRNLCNSAPIVIFRADSAGSIIYINPHWEKISGFSVRDTQGQGWLSVVHPEDRASVGEFWRAEVKARRLCLREFRVLNPQGKTILMRAQASPILDHDGGCRGYVGVIEDVTEIRQAMQELTRTQKLESLGVLAGGIAHDFNNILTAIIGNISLARLQLDDPDKVMARLTQTENAAARAKDLTQQLLTFARGGEPVKQVVRLESLLRDTAVFACHGSTVSCVFTVAEDLWPVHADEGQLFQVINNLVLNAVHAMPGGGVVTVGAENDGAKLEGKRAVKIYVADCGDGIPQAHFQRIFDPYFTTKKQGSGLGLATSFSIVKKHDGIITFESSPGAGTTFYVYLPALEKEDAGPREAELEVVPGCGRILVMDDEEVVREIARAMLEQLGYAVDCARDGAEAVALYQERKAAGVPYDAVVFDLTIPGGMGGQEAIGVLLKSDPAVRAIVSSGYSNDPVMANYRQYGFSAVLKKPYRLQEMSTILQQCLASGTAPAR
jgi:two-component system, cell cycle sensor histidine kinase and response regulator CckA